MLLIVLRLFFHPIDNLVSIRVRYAARSGITHSGFPRKSCWMYKMSALHNLG